MSDTEFNRNMETIEGGGDAVYGGSNSSDFIAALKTKELSDYPIKIENTKIIKDNGNDNLIIKVYPPQSHTINNLADVDWNKFVNGIFKTVEIKKTGNNNNEGRDFILFTLNSNNQIVQKLKTDDSGISNLKSVSFPIGKYYKLKQAMLQIINHIANKSKENAEIALSESSSSGGSIDFVHPRFEMSLNTFGSLALYNKKTIDNNKQITEIDRPVGYATGTKPLLQITSTAGVGSTPDITEEMKTLFKDFLTFFNFVITLLTHNKLFNNGEVETKKTFGKVTYNDNLKTFLTDRIYDRGYTTAYWPLLRILGHINEIQKPTPGSVYKPNTNKWKNTGMKKDGNDWIYVNENATTESGFTLIMDMLKEVEAMNDKNNTMKVEIDLKEVCKLLAMLTQQHAVVGVKATLVDALLKIVNAPETAPAAETPTPTTTPVEIYKAFLNSAYRGVLDQLIDKAVEDTKTAEGTGVADDLKAVADELKKVAVDLNTVAGKLTAKPEAAAAAATAAEIAEKAATAAEIAATSSDEELTSALETAKGALKTANDALVEANKALGTAEGGQKSKTLKRRQQRKNKSQRRFAYGGRKAYDQRKKQRQQQKQQN